MQNSSKKYNRKGVVLSENRAKKTGVGIDLVEIEIPSAQIFGTNYRYYMYYRRYMYYLYNTFSRNLQYLKVMFELESPFTHKCMCYKILPSATEGFAVFDKVTA